MDGCTWFLISCFCHLFHIIKAVVGEACLMLLECTRPVRAGREFLATIFVDVDWAGCEERLRAAERRESIDK
jgi:hypothetical protein